MYALSVTQSVNFGELQARLPEIDELEKQIKASHEELTDQRFAAEAAATAAAAAAAAALETARAESAAALEALRADAASAAADAAKRLQVLNSIFLHSFDGGRQMHCTIARQHTVSTSSFSLVQALDTPLVLTILRMHRRHPAQMLT